MQKRLLHEQIQEFDGEKIKEYNDLTTATANAWNSSLSWSGNYVQICRAVYFKGKKKH